ncbi:MAG: efflux RND transporter permease subunit [Planctomycetaceae bacterium]
MNAYADFVCDRRGWLALLVVAVTILAGVGLTRLRLDEDPRALFHRPGPEWDSLQRLFADFGPDDTDVIVTVRAADLFSPPAIAALRTLVARLEALPEVESVDSLLDARRPDRPALPLVPITPTADNLPRARELALVHPAVAGQILSADGTTTFLHAQLAGRQVATSKVAPQVAAITAAVTDAARGTPLDVGVAGLPVARVEMLVLTQREAFRSFVWSALITAIVGIVAFRNVFAVLAAVAGPTVGTLWALGAVGWLGGSLNGFNMALPSLVYGIAFADTVHMIVDFTAERRAGLGRIEALRRMMRTVGRACVLMVFTTVVGFGALGVAEMEAIRRFGITSALGTTLGFAAVLTVTPWLLGGPLGDLVQPRGAAPAAGDAGWAVRWARWLLGRPRAAVAVSLAATAALTAVSAGLKADTCIRENVPGDSSIARAMALCDAAIGGSLPSSVAVAWPADAEPELPADVLREVHAALADRPWLGTPCSALTIAAGLVRNGTVADAGMADVARIPPRIRDHFVRPDLRRAAVFVPSTDCGAQKLLVVYDDVRRSLREIERRHPGVRCDLTGTSVVSVANLHGIIRDTAASLLVSSVVIIATMMVAFRSVRLGLICLVPTMFPVVAAAGCLVAVGEPLRIVGVLTFSVCLGLADDNTIHLVSRFRQELAGGHGVRAAVERALAASGPAMVIMCLTLAAGLAPMTWSGNPALRTFGGLTLAALAASLFADLVILPPLLALFARESPAAMMSPEEPT